MPTTPSAAPMLPIPYPWHSAFRPMFFNLPALLARPLGASLSCKLLRRTIRAMPKCKNALTFCCPFCRSGEMNRPKLVHRAWLDSRCVLHLRWHHFQTVFTSRFVSFSLPLHLSQFGLTLNIPQSNISFNKNSGFFF